MCTVTYIPQEEGFILTSNRDESAVRSSKNLTRIDQEGTELVFPRDTTAGGTWIAVSETNRLVCVLNGAFIKHKHRPPYRRSRGLIVLDFFKYPNAESFFENFDFEGIEPFTMVIFDNGNLYEFRWDEAQKHVLKLDASEKYIWSSCTLYNPEWQEKRASWFQEWKKSRIEFSRNDILNFHKNGGEKDTWNGFIMNRMDLVQTVSITSISQNPEGFDMKYFDLVNDDMKQESVNFKNRFVKKLL